MLRQLKFSYPFCRLNWLFCLNVGNVAVGPAEEDGNMENNVEDDEEEEEEEDDEVI